MARQVNELTITGGFGDPVLDAQAGFKALMDAMARPGTIHKPSVAIVPPFPMNPMAGLVALTLCDPDTPVWLDERLSVDSGVSDWLSFHTGANFVRDAGDAIFAFIAEAATSRLDGFALGTQEYPDRSATLIVQVAGFEEEPDWNLTGPGIEHETSFRPLGLPENFLAFWEKNSTHFPRGVDLVFASEDALAAMPRTTRIALSGSEREAA